MQAPIRTLIAAVALLLAIAPTAVARQAEDVQRTAEELEALKAQISADEAQLERTVSAERTTLRQLEQIDRDIKLREQLVSTYTRRIAELETEVDTVWKQIDGLAKRVEELKEDYALRVRNAYKHGRLNSVALVLAATSVNQMLVRVNYLRRYQTVRSRRRDDLQQTSEQLERRRLQLQEILDQTEIMSLEATSEKERLAESRRERARVVASLRDRRQEMERELEAKRDAERNLSVRLASLREAAARRRAASGDGALDAAFNALTGAFEDNRGRLPWPAPGTLLERFGWTADPVYGTRVNNRMIYVATTGGTDIRAVFEGVVQDVDIMPTYGRYVMVAHGEYWTVYGNLSSASVQPGAVVSAGDVLGQTGATTTERGTGYFFGLFKDNDFTDPLPWLLAR